MIFLFGLCLCISICYCIGEICYERDWLRRTFLYRVAILFLLLRSSGFAQEYRVDAPLKTSGPNVPTNGGPHPQALWVANATAPICPDPNSTYAAYLANPIITYTDSTRSTACPTNPQRMQLRGTICTNSAGRTADAGFWCAGGNVDTFATNTYGTFGSYTVATLGSGALCPLTGCTFTRSLSGPEALSNVNRVISVIAAPYNAKCDGVTDDTAAIQGAFTAAAETPRLSIQFPAGTCLTGTIVWKGQSFFGAGIGNTIIKGLPTQDVFATPDSNTALPADTYVHDLTVEVDNSVNAAATAVRGNNTFPNRISGTAGGTTPLTNPPAPGGFTFQNTMGTCYGQMTMGSPTFTMPCAGFTQVPSSFLVGQTIVVNGAASAGGTLRATVSAVVDATHLTLATNALASTTTATGSIAAGVTQPPWYFGNAAFAMPGSNGANLAIINRWTWRNVYVVSVNGGIDANYSTAFFIQAIPYGLHFDNVTTNQLWGGIVEAPPASNNTSYWAWTDDTASYKDVSLYQNTIPMTWYNGGHRVVNGLNIYGGNTPFSLGMFEFSASLGSSSSPPFGASINSLYFECFSPNSGEIERFSGSQEAINGGSPGQCQPPSYESWYGNEGNVTAEFDNGLALYGSQNKFAQTALQQGSLRDEGWGNQIQGGKNSSNAFFHRQFYVGPRPAQYPLNSVDGGSVATGNSGTPYISYADLRTQCDDYMFPFAGRSGLTCVVDPTGSELTRSYIHVTGPALSDGAFGMYQDGASNYPLWGFGYHFPLTTVYMQSMGRCEGAASCSATWIFQDLTTSATLTHCTVIYTSSWTIQGVPGSGSQCAINLSSATPGDIGGWSTETAWSGSPTAVDIAYVDFEPYPTDTVNLALAAMTQHGSIYGETPTLSSVSGSAFYSPRLLNISGTLANVTGVAASFTCSGNPTFTLEDCGTSASCGSPTALGAVTLRAANTITEASASGWLVSGHYLVWQLTAGTCTTLQVSATATY